MTAIDIYNEDDVVYHSRQQLLSLHGMSLILLVSGAVWWPERSMLVVSDLHFGKSSHAAGKGEMWPPYDAGETIENLSRIVESLRPERVVCLGDSFHYSVAACLMPACYRAMLANLQLGCDWIWITGNHDPAGSPVLGGRILTELREGPLIFRHKLNGSDQGEIVGHLHPIARIRESGRAIRRPCFIANHQKLILPSFGSLTGGLNVLNPEFNPVTAYSEYYVYLLSELGILQIDTSRLRPDRR